MTPHRGWLFVCWLVVGWFTFSSEHNSSRIIKDEDSFQSHQATLLSACCAGPEHHVFSTASCTNAPRESAGCGRAI